MITPLKSDNSAVTAPLDHGKISALILDDSQFDRMKIRRMLNTTGIPVYLDETDTLSSLCSVLDKQEFDIILVDYNLSDSTGIDALELVQNHPLNANAATIMITGYDQSAIAVQAFKMGCTDYLTKEQLSSERLRASVLSAIEQADLAREETHRHDSYTEKYAQTVLARYASGLQPDLAHVVRDLRALKTFSAETEEDFVSRIDEIEQRCIRLWSALADAEAPTGTFKLSTRVQ